MKLGLVVLNYNDSETTVSFLNQIQKYGIIEKIVVVDNHSSDDSFTRLKELDNDKIDVIQTNENRGYAAGNNYGVKYLTKEYAPKCIIISNPDVFFEESVIETMLGYLEKLPGAAAVTCKMNCLSGIKLPIAWKLPKYKDCLVQDSYIFKKVFGDPLEYKEDRLKSEISLVDVLPGSMFMTKTEAFDKVGGFDEHTFLYYEENILAYKFQKAGYKSYLINNCSYDHKHSVSIDKNIASVKKRFEVAYKSREWYCKEYLGASSIQLKLLHIFYKIGVFNYLIYKKIKG
ncbi:glycosyltransferase family 2 protein [Butyrivibrio sp. INlla21]|uniref:glycosyltransferase family 2 protein n=1 Tax=Butyrivibrio sp. INlla21 TaxID=1520811 RepID=UPI0008EA90B0|nr:glycosyltransferase family 2 protein [Butyrivibrio sp. INlla21]SFV03129.1 Glycosyl transferase family 2 [Butyrivibrio sp. INlla21]